MINKTKGQIFIDGKPAHEIGALIAKRGLVGSVRTELGPRTVNIEHEVAYCHGCKSEKPAVKFVGPLIESRRGLSGRCETCAKKPDIGI